MAKEDKINKNETEFHKKIMKILSDNGYTNCSDNNIAFMVENTSDDVILDHNFMSTGIRFKKDEISKEEIIESGFKYYSTWHANL